MPGMLIPRAALAPLLWCSLAGPTAATGRGAHPFCGSAAAGKCSSRAPTSSVGSQLPAAPRGWCQPSRRADPLPCHPARERKKPNLSAKRHRSVPAGKAAGDPANVGRHAKGGAPHTGRGVPVGCPAAAGAWRAGTTVSTLPGLCLCVSVNPPGVSAKRRLIQLK